MSILANLASNKFESVSIIIAAINETVSLRKTVEILYSTCDLKDIREIIVVVSAKKSTPECIATANQLKAQAQCAFSVLEQTRPFAGGAYQDAFDAAQGSHLIMMAADMETNPADVCRMITESKAHPQSVICTSRWIGASRFGKGYNPVKYVANFLFQKIISILYWGNLTDWTFGFRLFPAKIMKSIRWEEMRHPFFLETILKPLRLGVPAREIATDWQARDEGESQNSFWRNFLYFKIAFKTRLASKQSLLNHEH